MNTFSEEFNRPSWLAPQGPREGLSHYAEVVRDRLRLIIGCVVVSSWRLSSMRRSRRAPRRPNRICSSRRSSGSNLVGLGLITQSSNPAGDISTAASLVTTSEVASIVAAHLGDTNARAVLEKVSAVPVAQSNVVAITATASSAAAAQALANGFAFATVENRTQALHRQLAAIIPPLQEQVRDFPRRSKSGRGRSANASPRWRRCSPGRTRR